MRRFINIFWASAGAVAAWTLASGLLILSFGLFVPLWVLWQVMKASAEVGLIFAYLGAALYKTARERDNNKQESNEEVINEDE